MSYQVTCIRKRDRDDPYERITHIGGSADGPGGGAWMLTQEEAIDGIESGRWSFFVSRAGRTANVAVATSRHGNKYLRTDADDDVPNNLLSLPECP